MPSQLLLTDNEPMEKWHTFKEILQRLHSEGIYIHSEQLAEFFLAHGLPVDLHHVPKHLKARARLVNENYQGDIARFSEELHEPYWDLNELW